MGLLPHQFWALTPVEYKYWSKSIENADRRSWALLSNLLAFLYNRKRGKGHAAKDPSAFNIYSQQIQPSAKAELDNVTELFKRTRFKRKKTP